MWQAKAMAHPTVSRSPAASERPSPTVSIASPTKASNTPTSVGILTTAGRPAIRLANAANKGVKTTYSPVIKPELEALVRQPFGLESEPRKEEDPEQRPVPPHRPRPREGEQGEDDTTEQESPGDERHRRENGDAFDHDEGGAKRNAAKQRANAATSGRRIPRSGERRWASRRFPLIAGGQRLCSAPSGRLYARRCRRSSAPMARYRPDRRRAATAIFNRLRRRYPRHPHRAQLREPMAAAGGHRSLRPDDRRKREQDRPCFVRPVPDPHALAEADPEEVERLVYSTGFYRQKTESIIALSVDLVERHRGEVPASLDELVPLRGVGRKTASVVLAEAFGQPAIAVDTHVRRVSNRLGLTNGQNPLKIEQDLKAVFPRSTWSKLSMSVIQFGACTARSPRCPECELARLCPWPYKTGPDTAGPDTAGPHTAGPDTAGPDTAGPDTAGPDTPGPDTAGPDTPGPDTPGQNAGMTTDGAAKGDDRPANPAARSPGAGDAGDRSLGIPHRHRFRRPTRRGPAGRPRGRHRRVLIRLLPLQLPGVRDDTALGGAIGRGIRSALAGSPGRCWP